MIVRSSRQAQNTQIRKYLIIFQWIFLRHFYIGTTYITHPPTLLKTLLFLKVCTPPNATLGSKYYLLGTNIKLKPSHLFFTFKVGFFFYSFYACLIMKSNAYRGVLLLELTAGVFAHLKSLVLTHGEMEKLYSKFDSKVRKLTITDLRPSNNIKLI